MVMVQESRVGGLRVTILVLQSELQCLDKVLPGLDTYIPTRAFPGPI